MIKVMFAGGKTGGHIFPAIAMAKELKKRHPHSRISFAGTEGGLEAKIVPPLGFELSFIRVKGFSRRSYLYNVFLGVYVLKSLCQAYRLLSLKKPNLVVGTGGYVSFPIVFVATLRRIPTILQEQNSYPGISTRILAHFANVVCLSYPESIRYFGLSGKIRVIGNPIREDLIGGEKSQARNKLHLDQNKRTVFVFGGSQGAHGINVTMLQSLKLLKSDCQVLWQTGESDYAEISEKTRNQRIKCMVLPFIEDMASAYAASDIVVSRSGALTLAEITACGKPSLLIPFPFATTDHQRHNAEALQKRGAARMILQKDLTPERLAQEIDSLLTDEVNLKNMAKHSMEMGKPEAASLLVDEMEKLLKDKM